MTNELQKEIIQLKEEKNAIILAHNYQPKEVQEIADFLARRIYEMAGYCVMSALLLRDASENEQLFAPSLVRFVAIGESIVAGHGTYIKNFNVELLNKYKQ